MYWSSNSSKLLSHLLTAYFAWLCTGNDNPYRMNYQRCSHRFPILYTFYLSKSIRCYFSNNVCSTVDIGIDLLLICCLIQTKHDTLAAKDVLRLVARPANRLKVEVQERCLARVRLFSDQHR